MGSGSRGDFKILVVVLIAVAVLVAIAFMAGTFLLTGIMHALEPGVGLKEAVPWSFGITVLLFIVFAIAAGDGLLGELQYMLLGFFAFFVIITLLMAWVS